MTEDDFRKLALSLPEAEESSHMNHPDFRVGGKIFATAKPCSRPGAIAQRRE
jgi:predicted DNA-binding protein (MmcQ/YjbR family)